MEGYKKILENGGGRVMGKRVVEILGAGSEAGGSQPGCRMGPASLRTAGLVATLGSLGYEVVDRGDLTISHSGEGESPQSTKYPRTRRLGEAVFLDQNFDGDEPRDGKEWLFPDFHGRRPFGGAGNGAGSRPGGQGGRQGILPALAGRTQ